jgi:HPt (histidine-containing phosphotransfer) domain-containing protein
MTKDKQSVVPQQLSPPCNDQSVSLTPNTLAQLLAPFAGKQAFYRRLIAIFETNLRQQLSTIESLIAQQDITALLKLVHTLKGTSGTAGLPTLHHTLRAWEQFLTQCMQTEAGVELTHYAELGTHISDVAERELKAIHALLATATLDTATVIQAPDAITAAQITAELAKLKQALLDGNLNAVERCQALQAKLAKDSPFAPDVIALCHSVDELDFDSALNQLAALSFKLK